MFIEEISFLTIKEVNSWFSKFMLESNDIEGENMVYDNHLEAALLSVDNSFKPNLNSIRQLHKILGKKIRAGWVGEFRKCALSFPEDTPRWEVVPEQLDQLLRKANKMSAFELYIRFEFIHPFADLNGRVGRLLWLRRTIQEGVFSVNQIRRLGFLKIYHYQALDFLKQNSNGLS